MVGRSIVIHRNDATASRWVCATTLTNANTPYNHPRDDLVETTALIVQRTLTARRVERLARKPFSVNELIGPLAKEEPIYANVDQEIRDW